MLGSSGLRTADFGVTESRSVQFDSRTTAAAASTSRSSVEQERAGDEGGEVGGEGGREGAQPSEDAVGLEGGPAGNTVYQRRGQREHPASGPQWALFWRSAPGNRDPRVRPLVLHALAR